MSTSTPQTSGLSKLKVAELREKLEELGLSTVGTKPVLLTRLKEALMTSSPISSDLNTPNKKDEATRTGTPARRSKRTSESFTDYLETNIGVSGRGQKSSRPGTPLKKVKQDTARPSTPVRRSRRLSGSLEVESSVIENPQQEKTVIETIEEDAEEQQETEDSKDQESKPTPDTEQRNALQQKPGKEEKNKEETREQEEKKENIPMVKLLDKMFTSKSIPRQKPKSGRFWKGERAQFRQIKRDRGQRPSFEQRLKIKDEKLRNKELADFMKNKKNQEKEELRKRIEENKAKKLENERRTEQYQLVKNPAKIKRMKKKQLRMLEKRDILPTK